MHPSLCSGRAQINRRPQVAGTPRPAVPLRGSWA